jgi:putative heme-binding domain-containing protein
MLAKLRPAGPLALLLGVAGILMASLVDVRWPSLALCATGVLAALLAVPAALGRRSGSDWPWIALGGLINGGLLGVALFAPDRLNPRWLIVETPAAGDLGPLVRVAAARPMDSGRPLTDEEWVDAAGEAIRQGDLVIAIKSAKSADLTGHSGTARLHVHLRMRQMRPDRTITFGGFGRREHTPTLTNEAGEAYAFVGHFAQRFSAAFDLVPLRVDQMLVFELPPAGTETLKLTVPASAWGAAGVCRFRIKGIEREPPPNLARELVKYKKLLGTRPTTPPDAALGRAIFSKHCQECHVLFGVGGKTGPDLTAVKRTDRDHLLKSIVDPSAEIAKGYETKLVVTKSGQLITGIVKSMTDDEVDIQTSGRKVLVPRHDVDEIVPSKVSLMPTDLLKTCNEHEVRSLIAYLSGSHQTPILARPETVIFFSTITEELAGWKRRRGEWKVEEGEIVVAGTTEGEPPVLISEMLVGEDFTVTLRVHPGMDGRGAVLVMGEDMSAAKAVRVEWSADAGVVLVGRDGKSVRSDDGEPNVVKSDAWNELTLWVADKRLSVSLNGKEAASLADAVLSPRRLIALEGPRGAERTIRFGKLDLQLRTAEKAE